MSLTPRQDTDTPARHPDTDAPARRSGVAVAGEEVGVDAGRLVAAEQALDVAGHDIDFDIDRIAGLARTECGVRDRVRNQVDAEARSVDLVDGQAGAVDGHRTLVRDVTRQVARHLEQPALRTPVTGHRQ